MNIPVLRAARQQEAEQCCSSQHAEHGRSIAIANEIRPARHRFLGCAPGARPDLTKQIINRLIPGLRRTEILAQQGDQRFDPQNILISSRNAFGNDVDSPTICHTDCSLADCRATHSAARTRMVVRTTNRTPAKVSPVNTP